MLACKKELESLSDPVKKAFFPRFFKTGPGQYGEGDVFIGVTVPQVRSVMKQYRDLSFDDLEELLADPVHECRLLALLILVDQCRRTDPQKRGAIVAFYLSHLKGVNNWDLVDCSTAQIWGEYLADGKGDIGMLTEFATSGDLWKERIAMVATYAFIRRGELRHTFVMADLLMAHPHDLIHKAAGWMLREAGKKDRPALERYLEKHCRVMPRTMLRYALEKFGPQERARYMKPST